MKSVGPANDPVNWPRSRHQLNTRQWHSNQNGLHVNWAWLDSAQSHRLGISLSRSTPKKHWAEGFADTLLLCVCVASIVITETGRWKLKGSILAPVKPYGLCISVQSRQLICWKHRIGPDGPREWRLCVQRLLLCNVKTQHWMPRSGRAGLKQPTVVKSTTIHSIPAAVAQFSSSASG